MPWNFTAIKMPPNDKCIVLERFGLRMRLAMSGIGMRPGVRLHVYIMDRCCESTLSWLTQWQGCLQFCRWRNWAPTCTGVLHLKLLLKPGKVCIQTTNVFVHLRGVQHQCWHHTICTCAYDAYMSMYSLWLGCTDMEFSRYSDNRYWIRNVCRYR